MPNEPIKLHGDTGRDESRRPERRFKLFELREESFRFAFEHDLFLYEGILRKQPDGSFAGSFVARGAYNTRDCEASCNLSKSGDDGYALIGRWREKDNDERNMQPHFWWAELFLDDG